MSRTKSILIFTAIYLCVALYAISAYLSADHSWYAIGISLLMALAPAPIIAFVIWSLDRYESEPAWMLLLCFTWGATVALLAALVLNTSIGTVLAGTFDVSLEKVTATFVAPVIEELSKVIILIILFFIMKKEFNSITDGIIYAMMVGLGFAVTENIFYYTRSIYFGGLASGLETFYARGVMSPFAHPIFTSLSGIALVLSMRFKKAIWKIFVVVSGILLAMLTHALWNGSAIWLGEEGFRLMYFIIFIPVFFGIMALIWYSLGKESKIILKQLKSEPDAEYLSSYVKRTKELIKNLFTNWRKLNIRWKYHRYATDYAFSLENGESYDDLKDMYYLYRETLKNQEA